MDPVFRWVCPSMTDLHQVKSLLSVVQPRFKTMLLYFLNPGSFRTVPALSLPSRYSIMLVSVVRPETSLKPATMMPSIFT